MVAAQVPLSTEGTPHPPAVRSVGVADGSQLSLSGSSLPSVTGAELSVGEAGATVVTKMQFNFSPYLGCASHFLKGVVFESTCQNTFGMHISTSESIQGTWT